MRKFAGLFLTAWLMITVCPAFSALAGTPACCSDCKGGFCPIKKETSRNHDLPCHKTADAQKCKIASTGCDHDKPQLVFFYDAVFFSELRISPLVISSRVSQTEADSNTDFLAIDLPPPKILL